MAREQEPGERPPRDWHQQLRERQQERLLQRQQQMRERQQQARERQQIRERHQQQRQEHGRGRGRQRGPDRARLQLSREEVVRAALAIVDREGLDGFSMRKLGRELGVDPMAAYYYFPNKAAVLDGIVDAVLAEVNPHVDPNAPWDDQLREVARAQAAALRAHPHALPVISTHPPFTEASIRQIEETATILHAAGLSPRDAVQAIETLSFYLIGSALAEVGLQPGGVADPTEAEARDRIAQLPRDEFPILTAAFAEWTPSAQEAGFEDGLETFIAGIKARYAGVIMAGHSDTSA